MGTWGVAIFSDDLAADLRGDFRELVGEGLSPSEATERLMAQYASSLDDPDEMPVFWIALALTQWKLGRLEPRTKTKALRVIDDGTDLSRWDDPKNRAKRAAVLAKVRAELLSTQPPAKRVPRTVKEANNWEIGEIIGFQLLSGNWTLFRVIGHHTDKGGRFAVCELLNWVDEQLPRQDVIATLTVRRENSPRGISQFMFQQPKKKLHQARVVRTGLSTTPEQTKGGFTCLIWPYVDDELSSIFGLS
ncbi:MAG: hypothetical protein R2684_08930 [Pyrinomonadaceae bacterium]